MGGLVSKGIGALGALLILVGAGCGGPPCRSESDCDFGTHCARRVNGAGQVVGSPAWFIGLDENRSERTACAVFPGPVAGRDGVA